MAYRIPPPQDPPPKRNPSGLLAMALVVSVVLGVWLIQGRDPGSSTGLTEPSSSSSSSSTAGSTPATEGGLPTTSVADLPPEALETLELIDAGGPFPYDQDDETFGNFEGLLPDQGDGYYREYTVVTPGSEDRGARRIVAGEGGELYWTEDHYASFAVITR